MNDKNYFGVMLDVSRNAVMKTEQVKNLATILKSFGYNCIQLYTEDTYEIDGEPYFGYLRGRYTQEELKDIVAYCDSIGLEVIPCIQTLAHLERIFKWATYRDVNDVSNILLVGEEKTYELIDKMFKTCRDCFTSKRINVGMDEAHLMGYGAYAKKHGLPTDRFEVLNAHLNRVRAIAEKYGFQLMMWSDMFFRLANHGEYFGNHVTVPDEVKAKTPKDISLIYWDYYQLKKSNYVNMIRSHKQFGNELWYAGAVWCWVGFCPLSSFSLKAMKKSMLACREEGVNNVLITAWGDDGRECSFFSLLPLFFAVRQFYDGVTDMRVIKKRFNELTGENFDSLFALEKPELVAGDKPWSNDPAKFMLYSDPFLGFLDPTTKEVAVAEYRALAKRFAKHAKKGAYGYIFDCISKLCYVLEDKYYLGVRTRQAYQAKDMEAIKALLPVYKRLDGKLERFYRALRVLWFEENKPQGFEVQEQRLGGLKLRVRSCGERLQAFADGKLDRIDELEETLLDFWGGGEKIRTDTPTYNIWSEIVSPNGV